MAQRPKGTGHIRPRLSILCKTSHKRRRRKRIPKWRHLARWDREFQARHEYTCHYCDHDPYIFPGDKYIREVWAHGSYMEVRRRHRDPCPEDPRLEGCKHGKADVEFEEAA